MRRSSGDLSWQLKSRRKRIEEKIEQDTASQSEKAGVWQRLCPVLACINVIQLRGG